MVTHWLGSRLLGGDTEILSLGGLQTAQLQSCPDTMQCAVTASANVPAAWEVTWLCQTLLLGTVQLPLMTVSQGKCCCLTERLLCCPRGFAGPPREHLL